MAVLFLGQFGLGWYMQGARDLMAQYNLYQWHKSFGFLILGLAAIRILWAVTSRRPRLRAARLAATMPESSRKSYPTTCGTLDARSA